MDDIVARFTKMAESKCGYRRNQIPCK